MWRAFDTVIDRAVAIKMLLPHFAQDEKFEQRFRREARAAARLDNPHIVPIYDVGEINGRLYVAMRLITGRDLQTLLDAGALAPHRAAAIIGQIAKALHAAHTVGLIHRDIEPSNILLDDDDFAYLIDFGIARAAGETGLTSTGATVGTWSYMAPERFSTGQAEASSDIYALACVLYQCLTGELPFPAVALEQIAVAHMTAPPPRPSTRHGGIPPAMDEVVRVGLAKNPGDRFSTARDLARAAVAAADQSVRLPITPVQEREDPIGGTLPSSPPGPALHSTRPGTATPATSRPAAQHTATELGPTRAYAPDHGHGSAPPPPAFAPRHPDPARRSSNAAAPPGGPGRSPTRRAKVAGLAIAGVVVVVLVLAGVFIAQQDSS